MPVSLDRVAQLALALPETAENTDGRGRRSWTVRGTNFAWERPFSKADIKRFGDEPVPTGDILGLRVADEHEKQAVLAEHPSCVFTISHFDGYPAVLVHLRSARVGVLRGLLEDAWAAKAPADLVRRHRMMEA